LLAVHFHRVEKHSSTGPQSQSAARPIKPRPFVVHPIKPYQAGKPLPDALAVGR
jgi:hypothetical protein